MQSPDPGPLLVTVDPAASDELCQRLRAKLPEGSLLTGPNYPILDVRPLAGVPLTNVTNLVDRDALDATVCPVCGLSELLDARPAELGEAITAAAAAIALAAPGTPTSAVEHYAEVAIDAALKWVAGGDSDETPSDRAEVQDGAAGGDQGGEGSTHSEIPPAEHPEQ